jgi:hypothetical protein
LIPYLQAALTEPFSKIFTAQYAENSGAIRGVLGVEAPAFTAGVSNVSSSGFAL